MAKSIYRLEIRTCPSDNERRGLNFILKSGKKEKGAELKGRKMSILSLSRLRWPGKNEKQNLDSRWNVISVQNFLLPWKVSQKIMPWRLNWLWGAVLCLFVLKKKQYEER